MGSENRPGKDQTEAPPAPAAASKKAARLARSARALRENLRRRKKSRPGNGSPEEKTGRSG